MKKLICFLIISCLIITGVVNSYGAGGVGATDENVFCFDGNVEILFLDDKAILEKQESIAEFIYYDNEGTVTCGLACLFGHSLQKTAVSETEHNAYTSSPKCLQNTYEVTYCTRSSCDYMVKDLIKSQRISICHG